MTSDNDAKPILSYRSAYGFYAIALLVLIVVSLLPTYFPLMVSDPEALAPEIRIHGAVFFAWYIFFTIQVGLKGARRLALHKLLGALSIPLVAYLVYEGALVLWGVMASYDPAWSEAFLRGRVSFVWAIIHTLVSFATFYGLAILYRKNGAAHRRLMLLAALSMVSASVTRFAYVSFVPIDGTALTLILTYVFFLVPVLVEFVQRRRVHPALVWGTILYLVTQLLAMGLMPSTALGRALAFPV